MAVASRTKQTAETMRTAVGCAASATDQVVAHPPHDCSRSRRAAEAGSAAPAILHEAQHLTGRALFEAYGSIAHRSLVAHAPGIDDGDHSCERLVAAVEEHGAAVGAGVGDRHDGRCVARESRDPPVPGAGELLGAGNGER